MSAHNSSSESPTEKTPNSVDQSTQNDMDIDSLSNDLQKSCKVTVIDDKVKSTNTTPSPTRTTTNPTAQTENSSTSAGFIGNSSKTTVKPAIRIPSYDSTESFLKTHRINPQITERDHGTSFITVHGEVRTFKSVYNVRLESDLTFIEGRLTDKLGFMLVKAIYLDERSDTEILSPIILSMNAFNTKLQQANPSHRLKFQFVPNRDAPPLSNQFFVITPTSKDLQISQGQMNIFRRQLLKDLTEPPIPLNTGMSKHFAPRKFKIQLCHMPNSRFVFSCSIMIPNELYLSLSRILSILFPQNEFTICTVLAVGANAFSFRCESSDFFNVQVVGFMLRTAFQLSDEPFLNEYKDSPDVLPHEKALMESIKMNMCCAC
ncbi:unnamed protein product [Ambrosiozyma monospora]|uniref:Unnamed protein product n=1 Tax=Ambrosiozyma monospora TaxID=43982 RepID=A0A9W7DC53_AMBMO|nr:unnamed protein product [Ambrosiozyma monospora]